MLLEFQQSHRKLSVKEFYLNKVTVSRPANNNEKHHYGKTIIQKDMFGERYSAGNPFRVIGTSDKVLQSILMNSSSQSLI